MTLTDRLRTFAEDMRDEGVPLLVVYQEDGDWKLVGPPLWKDFAGALRSLAAQCDRMADGQRLN